MKLLRSGATFFACVGLVLAWGCCEKDVAPEKPGAAFPLPSKTIDIVEEAAVLSPTLPLDEPVEETVMEKVDIAALEASLDESVAEEVVEMPSLPTVIIPRKKEPPATEAAKSVVKPGDKVSVLYTGTLDDGTVFDASSRHGNVPFQFVAGRGQVVPGFDKAVVGMKLGEKKQVHIPCAEAYGQIDPRRVIEVPRSQFPAGMGLEVGRPVSMSGPDGRPFRFVIKEVGEDKVKLDGNHPMAGKDLNFELEVVKVEPGKK